MQSHYNVATMNEGSDGDAKLIAYVRIALDVPDMKGLILQLRLIALQVGREARWCEGCPCHEHILPSYHANRKRFSV